MAEKRHHKRINCAEKCLLYHADNRYSGAIMNISISGALISLTCPPSDIIKPGDACSFILSTSQESLFCRYSGRITHINPTGFGLEILEHEF